MFFTGGRPIRSRRDGRLVEELPAMRRVVPHLMTTRLEAALYYPQQLDLEVMAPWLERLNEGRPPEDRVKFFHVFLTAFARLYRRRPELNRFISGRRTYEHRDISFSFTVKRAMTDEADEEQVQISFTGTETLDEVRTRVNEALTRARRFDNSDTDKLINAFVRLPGPVLAAVARIAWTLDSLNMMPRVLQEAIPVYASAYVVNLGSLQADAPFHHLYLRGTASVFVALGTIRPEAVVDEDGTITARRQVRVVYTIDERVTDGFYLVRSAQLLQRMFDEPDALLRPGD